MRKSKCYKNILCQEWLKMPKGVKIIKENLNYQRKSKLWGNKNDEGIKMPRESQNALRESKFWEWVKIIRRESKVSGGVKIIRSQSDGVKIRAKESEF